MSQQPETPDGVPPAEPREAGPRRGGRRRALRDAHARMRLRLDAHPRLRSLYKIGVGVLGAVIVVVGLILVPLPGPGWLVVFVGVAVLGTEFPAAHRITQWVRRLARRARLRWRAWRVARSARRSSTVDASAVPSR
ncbi:TIGR02611 family protein [Frigoribacterium sp. PhB24]|uniref:TIGR02611 family protein n=1 Tax=Frigoribacterium sp. PhB24 TaxID=2485204 RepID=UPI000F460F12|nr:TIGR02611 family protein [Frigoribacterium sp. PhB24]